MVQTPGSLLNRLLSFNTQGGLCLVLGEPGTGKSVLKQALLNLDPKRLITPVLNRTLHTYHNTLRFARPGSLPPPPGRQNARSHHG